MTAAIDRRLDDVERALIPQALMTIPVSLIDLQTGQVVARIAARPIVKGDPIDYRKGLDYD